MSCSHCFIRTLGPAFMVLHGLTTRPDQTGQVVLPSLFISLSSHRFLSIPPSFFPLRLFVNLNANANVSAKSLVRHFPGQSQSFLLTTDSLGPRLLCLCPLVLVSAIAIHGG
ncbi:hypothetical protein E4U09_003933 [Claviceps aff. purpurea]|uniref:Uncharacterized protein n=1 Tax=Claviceps aff. purpurea TaxID=1967640 RepID=A0A9P7TXM4_9HYPO|nr:hypothetical protein E4U09_003933 [Claviceps aff. purpurea]